MGYDTNIQADYECNECASMEKEIKRLQSQTQLLREENEAFARNYSELQVMFGEVKVENTRLKEVLEDVKLRLADAQFIGYYHGRWQDLIGMVGAMGLTYNEWAKWKTDYAQSYLRESEVEEIDEYFQSLLTPKP